MVSAALLACLILAALGMFQLGLVAGLPLGHYAWGGGHRVLPIGLRCGSVVSIGLYAAMGWVLLAQAGVIGGGPRPWTGTAVWVLVGYFSLGVVMNAVSRSLPERRVMTPVALVLAVLSLVVALGGRA